MSTTDDDILIVDGTKVSETKRQDAFSFIDYHENSKEHKWTANACQKSLGLYYDNLGNMLLQSHFKEVDSCGRPIVYVFCFNGRNMNEFCKKLIDSSEQLGRTPKDTDLDFLKGLKKNSFTNHIFIIIISIVFVIWIITRICS